MRINGLKQLNIVFMAMILCICAMAPVMAKSSDSTVIIPVKQSFASKVDSVSSEFSYVLTTEQNYAPMPEGSSNLQYSWRMNGNSTGEIRIDVTQPGEYNYKIYQIVDKKTDYVYDRECYDVLIKAFYNENGAFTVITIVTNSNGEKVECASFDNKYTGSKPGSENVNKPDGNHRGDKGFGIKTGDESRIYGYLTLFVGSLICLIALLIDNRRHKKGDAENEA